MGMRCNSGSKSLLTFGIPLKRILKQTERIIPFQSEISFLMERNMHEPPMVARYVISLSFAFNKIYQECSILHEEDQETKMLILYLGEIAQSTLVMLFIELKLVNICDRHLHTVPRGLLVENVQSKFKYSG